MTRRGGKVLAEREKMGSVAIMGGTFDPIHYGHLVTAEAARVEFGLDKVIFVPSGHPPHKKDCRLSPAEDRYRMTVLATSNNLYFEVSRCELDRGGLSYAVDTVREFRSVYGEGVGLFFITGADASLEILTWKDACTLLGLCQLIAATRPGYCLSRLEAEIERIGIDYHRTIHVLEVPALAISSTDIRSRVRQGKSIRYLLPDSVEQYIKARKLYNE